jgi:hypothetical protein
MMSQIRNLSHQYHPSFMHEEVKTCSELAIIEMISKFHDQISQINALHAQGLQSTSNELERASEAFLEDLKKIFETEKAASKVSPIFKTLEYAASFMTIALGIGLCATGTAAVVGSIMIATGIFGCVHTTMELTDAYRHLASLTSDKHHQEIIRTYLPAIIATTLALTATITSTYSATVALPQTLNTIRKFLPLMMQSLQTTQLITKGVFDLHRNKAESKKIEHEALAKCLETILEEQKQAMMDNVNVESKMNKNALQTLKVLTSLYHHI